VEEPLETPLGVQTEHGERGQELLPSSGFAAFGEQFSSGEASVHRRVPEDAIAISQELLANRVDIERG
jgi:hypothetical protein